MLPIVDTLTRKSTKTALRRRTTTVRATAGASGSASTLEATIAAMAAGVVVYGLDGEAQYLNAAARDLVGEPQSSAPAGNNPLCVPPELVQRALKGETVRGAVQRVRNAQRSVSVSVSVAPVRGPAGAFLGAVATITDVTALHELEAQRDELLRAVSHDMRTPLTLALLNGQLLGEELGRLDLVEAKHRADSVVAAARRMDGMIQELVDCSRLAVGQLRLERERVDLAPFVADLLARAVDVIDQTRVVLEPAMNLCPVDIDPARLERALLGVLRTSLRWAPGRKILLKLEDHDGETHILVIDPGRVIPADELPHVFERGYRPRSTTPPSGLGLGLHIARLVIEAHGGRVQAESDPSGGSALRLVLPPCAGEAA
jgi:signal transduction histidine kinase